MKFVTLLLALLLPSVATAYPIYGSDELELRRLEATRFAQEGRINGRKRLPGELLSREQVDLRLLHHQDLQIPHIDDEFSQQILRLLGDQASNYSISVLDLTDPDQPVYAEHQGQKLRSPGSIGKLAAALGLFQALADVYPGVPEKRQEFLRDTWITTDEFIVTDHHKVRLWDPEKQTLSIRPLRIGDRGSLWDFLDWMLSASSNAAASMIMQQAMLLRHFGKDYPITPTARQDFFDKTPRKELANLLTATFLEPLSRNGIDRSQFRQGSFFTRTGKQRVPGTSSHATTRELMNFLLLMEQGKLVDEFTSRELKRLLYVTERRIRYASSPALRDAAVYFKSGSLYSCRPEPEFVCRKYQGNKKNLMNSVVIVEEPADEPKMFYMVTLTSNVLRKNAAVDHQTLATRIHRLMESRHGL
jgi:hypothetical protein